MSIFIDLVAFYCSTAIGTGIAVATFDYVRASYAGSPLRFPRLIAGACCGIVWPIFLYYLIATPRRST